MLIRWNDDPSKPLGNPVSHGYPTWFVLPDAFHTEALKHVRGASDEIADKAKAWLANNGPEEWPYDPTEFPNV